MVNRRIATVCVGVVLFALQAPDLISAAGPRALPEGKQPDDARLGPPKDLNGYFPFAVPTTKDAWSKRAADVRRRIAVSQGIWPTPEKTPLQAVIHGRIECSDYTVEKVYFESVPGFFVTGNLYRPKNAKGKSPGVLFPHGHWNDGRFIDIGRTAVRKEIVIGSERFEEGGRSLLQALPVQLARMGCVCLHYDMIGYADSQQLSFELAHRFAKQRPEMNDLQSWGLFSPQAESYLQSIMGLQTWNSVRALDFLLDLPDVDNTRVAVTGASGGGTQTMLLAAIDPRVTVSFPAVMVSTAMQGGCTCENSSLLRVGTGNVEFAALFAPKPQGLTAANDWTKEFATKGFPELKQMYEFLGEPKNVQLVNNTHFNHNYNYVNRSAFYAFLNKHFRLGIEEPVVEEDYIRLTRDQMSVWDDAHPRPPSGDDYERRLCRQLAEAATAQLERLIPTDSSGLATWRSSVGGAFATILHQSDLPADDDLQIHETSKTAGEGFTQHLGVLRDKHRSAELPVLLLRPAKWENRFTIWLADQGKAGLFAEDGTLVPEVKRLLAAGEAVVGVDLLSQGEFNSADAGPATNRSVKNPREFAGYTYGYNPALLAERAADVLTVIAGVRRHSPEKKVISLVALDGTAPTAAAALAFAQGAVQQAVLDTRGFRFLKVTDYLDANFLPGGAKYGDLDGLLSLAAPASLHLAGESEASLPVTKKVYAAAGAGGAISLASEGNPLTAADAVQWLISRQ